MSDSITVSLPSNKEESFERLFSLLTEQNQKYNLTAITEREDVYLKHFLDSLAAAPLLKQGGKGADIGAGAGFPSLPLLLARPDIKLTILDSVGKKLNFVRLALAELSLSARVVHARVEDFARSNRASLDFAVSRAVAPLAVLIEYAMPVLKVGGSFYAYKTDDSELKAAKNALTVFGAKAIVHRVDLAPLQRVIIEVIKTAPTPPRYPRTAGKAKSDPIV